jgi:2-aminoethylphosphonate-pyruvate transaminase
MSNHKLSLVDYAELRNHEKTLFTAGPAPLLVENLAGLRSCFGRNDDDYLMVQNDVLSRLKKISGHDQIVCLQGSASLALEIAILNFLKGRVLIVSTGFYSDRLYQLALSASRRDRLIHQVECVEWKKINDFHGSYDWVVACVAETSAGILLPVVQLNELAKRVNARLLVDATASIGLESHHNLADIVAYSSCKGLFGLSGAAFIAFNECPINKVDSFYLSLSTHLQRSVTGPYHAIASLYEVLPKLQDFVFSVKQNKLVFISKMAEYLTYPPENQPQLCTRVQCKIISQNKKAILYKPRGELVGSVVCHLGEAHLGSSSKGDILNMLEIAL